MTNWYQKDLAFIHDEGFKDFALKSAPGLLAHLRRRRIHEGLVVDLGCGSGLWACELLDAGYQAYGIDISEAMIRIARKRAPEASFRVESLFTAEIPRCRAVTSISECFNYLFDPQAGRQSLMPLFRRVYEALEPGGLFMFDLAEPGQIAAGLKVKGFTEGDGWLVLVEKEEDHRRQVLTRRIISLRKVGNRYRRSDETHRQQLYKSAEITAQLRRLGFRVQTVKRYGDHPLPKAHSAFIARKPG